MQTSRNKAFLEDMQTLADSIKQADLCLVWTSY